MSSANALYEDVVADLPLLRRTPESWASLAASHLPEFLQDHAVCEQQAALAALNLVAHYPEDEELVDRMTALALEEVSHLRKVAKLLRVRGKSPAKRRPNRYTAELHQFATRVGEPHRKADRLLIGALIEARSCERFTRLYTALSPEDDDVARLLEELGPAEKRHWELFHRLALREADPGWIAQRWQEWLNHEDQLQSGLGVHPTVHG